MKRTAFRMAEGSKQTFQFQEWPETAAFMKTLGADTTLGISGREHGTGTAMPRVRPGGNQQPQ